MECLHISIKGVVQGVGFRPFVFSLANELSVKGFITNTSDGVSITAEGDNLDIFLERLRKEAPPLAKIMSMDISPAGCAGFKDFSIHESVDTGSFTLVSSDISICADCLRELLDPEDRRFLYSFINCTNCGPRYSITRSVPYDRVNTTMHVFTMCRACEAEYRNPCNRRFHAQPNACPVCGPRISLIFGDETPAVGPEGLRKTTELLKDGKIVAIKGLGGFHLSCDAGNIDAVERLRERKRRNNKPFALMAGDVNTIKKFCHVSEYEELLLASPSRPIVLLRKRKDTEMPEAVSPNNRHLAFMLPYTPIHYLLFRMPQAAAPDVLVMTSGNISDEPIVIHNEDAVSKLSGLADAFLLHDRGIFMRVDDSVVRVRGRDPVVEKTGPSWSSIPDLSLFFIRRSRGYVPDPIPLNSDGPDVLGCGADLKNTFTLTKGRYAIPSQHIGDMENYETLRFFEETLRNLKMVYRAEPVAIAYDLHPGYLSTQWALKQGVDACSTAVTTCGIQHHYAHIASVMAEKGLEDKVIGVAFDGNGYGEDGTLWGGEFLIADLAGYRRAGHIAAVPLPGGEAAIREPWRIAVGYIIKAAGHEIWEYLEPSGFVQKYGREKIGNIIRISEQKSLSPLSSGAGRLFDAVSALIGVCDRNTFEGEAAMALESLVMDDLGDDYAVDISFKDPMEIDFSMTFLSILSDIRLGVEKGIIAAKFHNAVAFSVVKVVVKLALTNNLKKVVLSGGVFQNFHLLNRVVKDLRREGLQVFVNELVPCNDAGISLGQAYIIRERIKRGLICRT
ncbi:MAG: carbamoyltransferase HypF [Nitrospirae bacterium]|nr:carbamoyltransferase HypF [Nitrospirota bacterium]